MNREIVSVLRCPITYPRELLPAYATVEIEILRPSLSDGLIMTTFALVCERQNRTLEKCRLTSLADFFERFEKDYVGRMPQFVGNRAAGAAGDDYFEEVGRGCEIL